MPLVRKPPTGPVAAPSADPALLLTSGDSGQRWAAARAIADTPGGVEALAAALDQETDPHVRAAIFTGLTRAANPASVATILPYLRADDAQLRTSALDALRAMPGATLSALPGLLDDTDPDVRLLSCEIARALGGEAGAELMAGLLTQEPQVNVCASAVDVLAEIGGPAQIDALTVCAQRFPGEPFLSFAIQATIRRLGGARRV